MRLMIMMFLSPQDTMVIGRAGKVLRLIRVMRILRVFKVTSKISEHSKNCVLAACAAFHWAAEPPLHNAAGIPGAGASHGPPLGYRHYHLQVQEMKLSIFKENASSIAQKSDNSLSCSLIYFFC